MVFDLSSPLVRFFWYRRANVFYLNPNQQCLCRYIVIWIVVLLSFGYWNPFVINSEVKTIKIKYSIKVASSNLTETLIPVQTTPIGSNSRRIVLCGSQWNNEIRWIIDLHPITQFLILKSDQKSKTYSFW